jgi:hypothetical protein
MISAVNPLESVAMRGAIRGKVAGGEVMTFVPVMWSVWGLTVLIMAALILYRSRLSRDEEDQLFLDDSFNNEKNAQAAIVAKVNKVQPLVKISEIVAVLVTLFVIGYYINDVISQFR